MGSSLFLLKINSNCVHGSNCAPSPACGGGIGGLWPPSFIKNADAKHRLWVGVPPRVRLFVWREFPPPHRIFDALRPPPQAGEVKRAALIPPPDAGRRTSCLRGGFG